MKKLSFVAFLLVALAGFFFLQAKAWKATQTTRVEHVDTLRLEGPEKPFHNHTESNAGNIFKDPPMMRVKYGLSSKGLLTINSSEPLDSIKVTTAEGAPVKNFVLEGEKDVELDLNTMPMGSLKFFLKGKNGAENTLDVEN